MITKHCPFCGHTEIDPTEWLDQDGKQGPGCPMCGAMAESVERWNTRYVDHFLLQEAAIKHGIPYNTLCAIVNDVLSRTSVTADNDWPTH
jgi:hypothetical protein